MTLIERIVFQSFSGYFKKHSSNKDKLTNIYISYIFSTLIMNTLMLYLPTGYYNLPTVHRRRAFIAIGADYTYAICTLNSNVLLIQDRMI